MGTTGSANSFSFGVPSCVNKVEITHDTGTRDANTSNSKLVFDCSNANSVTCDYVNEITASNWGVSVTMKKSGIILTNVFSKVSGNNNAYQITIGDGNFYYVEIDKSKSANYPVYKLYWNQDVTVNGKTYNHVYSFKEGEDYVAYSLDTPFTETENDKYTPMMAITSVIKNKATTNKTPIIENLDTQVYFTYTTAVDATEENPTPRANAF